MKDLESRVLELEKANKEMTKQLTETKEVLNALLKLCSANTDSIDSHTKAINAITNSIGSHTNSINTHTVGLAAASFICRILSARFEGDAVLQALTAAQSKARATHELFSPISDDLIEQSRNYLAKILGPTLSRHLQQ